MGSSATAGFPGSSVGKEYVGNAGDPGSLPGLGRSPEEGNSYSLQYSCLENSTDRGAWQAIQSMGSHAKSQTTERLSLSLFFQCLPIRNLGPNPKSSPWPTKFYI